MPFTDGTFANVFGATNAAPGMIIQSAVWNAIHADYSTAFNMLMGQLITTPSYRNIAWMNGGFEVWQRGAGSSASIAVAASSTLYTADRWYLSTGANQNSTVAAQAGLVDASTLCARVQRNSGQTGTTAMRFAYPLDTDEITAMRGSFVTISFRVRAGANFSGGLSQIAIILYCGTGAVGKRNATPYTNEVTPINDNVVISTAVELASATSTIVVPVNTTQAELQITWTPTGTAGTDDYVELDDLQLEVNLSPSTFTPTSFDRLPFYTMLEACKRHYQKSLPYDVPAASGGGLTNSLLYYPVANSNFGFYWQYPVELRANPSTTKFHVITATGSNWYNGTTSATIGAAFSTIGSKALTIFTVGTASAEVVYTIHAAVSAGI